MKHLHFVGIGGARLSGLAKLYHDRGFSISGSDWQQSRVTQKLVEQGIQVHIGHQAANIAGADLVVYTNAVGKENPEVLKAVEQGVPLLEGAELLGKLMGEVGKGIAIAGTHGKTTTSAMTAMILTEGGIDPTVLIGGEVAAFDGNHRSGKSEYMVVEACEFKRSFLHLNPAMELITNIDWDHPDCFPTFADVVQTFADFVDRLPQDGVLVTWGDDPNAAGLLRRFPGKGISFGFQPQFDWELSEIRPEPPLGIAARLRYHGKDQGILRLAVPGRHNLQNAAGALAIAAELGVDLPTALATVGRFTGVHRRFEIKGKVNQALIVDDYAHHPGAIRTTLAAARGFFNGRIWCVFQPHLFSRTKYLLPEFARSFTDSDILVLADIYPAREVDPGDISSADLAREAAKHHQDVRYLGKLDRITEYLQQHLEPGDLVITMGAGDVWKVGERLVQNLSAYIG
jgi:UDP-N-acetylmuramate--alanine ligase